MLACGSQASQSGLSAAFKKLPFCQASGTLAEYDRPVVKN